jgi:hypothetical protein
VKDAAGEGDRDAIAKPVDARKLLEAVASRLEPAEIPVADLSKALGRLLGNRLLLTKFIEGFIEGADPARAELGAAVSRRHAQAVAFLAHRMRGQAAALDAARLIAALEETERESRNERWEAVDRAFEAVGTRMEELLQVLPSALASATPSR